jgi:ATP-dependent Lon protease
MIEQNLQKVKRVIVPLLPLRDVILFPHMVTPLLVGRDRSIRAIESSMEKDQRLLPST